MALKGEVKRNRAWTPREIEVLGLLMSGMSRKQIAVALHIDERTVKFHLGNIYENLNVKAGRGESKYHALMNRFGRFEISIRWVPNDPTLFPSEVLPNALED